MALDTTRDTLYVADGFVAIHAFANVSTATGNVAPARTITGATTKIGSARALWIDTVNDRLYVANANNVLVFDNASTTTGNIAPSRTITVNGATLSSFGVAVDVANDILYVSSRDSPTIHAVTASTAGSASTPLHTLSGLTTPMAIGVWNDTLFLETDGASKKIATWTAAKTRDGAVAPDKTVFFPTLVGVAGFAYVP